MGRGGGSGVRTRAAGSAPAPRRRHRHHVGYRALAGDVWPSDIPVDPRAALQSLASRLRRALPAGMLVSVPGGYRLDLAREEVDVTRFQDLVAAARRRGDIGLARKALDLWVGDPWTPHDGFDWLVRDLWQDRGHAERLAAAAPAHVTEPAKVAAAITGLVGRAAELDAIRDRLTTDRLVTVIGPGGAGKTTLAMESVRGASDVLIAELAPAAPGEVWAAVAGAVGHGIRLTETSGALPMTSRERVLDAVAGRRRWSVRRACNRRCVPTSQTERPVSPSRIWSRIPLSRRSPYSSDAQIVTYRTADHPFTSFRIA